MTAEQIERLRVEADRCQHQTGTQGRWARKWMALYEVYAATLTEVVVRDVARG